jgi:hypothetical protein
MTRQGRYPQELRERAIRMVFAPTSRPTGTGSGSSRSAGCCRSPQGRWGPSGGTPSRRSGGPWRHAQPRRTARPAPGPTGAPRRGPRRGPTPRGPAGAAAIKLGSPACSASVQQFLRRRSASSPAPTPGPAGVAPPPHHQRWPPCSALRAAPGQPGNDLRLEYWAASSTVSVRPIRGANVWWASHLVAQQGLSCADDGGPAGAVVTPHGPVL